VRALVTGGAGFIGSHLVDALLAQGDEVTIVDHLRPARAASFETAAARGARLMRGDVTDVAAMLEAFAAARPEVVYHLAAQIDVRRSVADPSTDAHVNVGGTAAVLEASRHAGVRRVILASTAGVYGDPATLPTPETSPVAPLSPYAASKAAAETYMALFARLHGLSTLSLRMANVYGPGQNPHGEAGVVAIFCAAAVERRPATIFGDGAQTRDDVFVRDVVDELLSAGRVDEQGVVNLSTGTEISVAALARELGVEAVAGPARLGEIVRSSLDPAKAARRLGWRARTPLAEGLRLTLETMTGGLPPPRDPAL
jgi:UDP-glucose 4-epimerase